MAATGMGMSEPLLRNGVVIDDSFAEAFPMKATRLVITAHRLDWARQAAVAATGFATSVIACGCEAGIERELGPDETPDGRPGVAVLLFAMSGKELAKQVERRVGQCVLTCPTTAVYAGLPDGEPIALGKNLRFFGDGWQMSKVIAGRRYWRVPVMDGEFVAQETTPVVKGVGGGNLLLVARDTDAALAVAEAAVAAMRRLPDVIMPFPGGVVRSGSKVGSKYPSLMASTNDAFCPSLTGMARRSELDGGARCVMEIVIDGLTEAAVAEAMHVGIEAAVAIGAAGGLLRIAAGNYGGKLGPFHFHLQRLQRTAAATTEAGDAPAAQAQPAAAGGNPGFRLTLRQALTLRLDLRGVVSAALAGKSADEVAAITVPVGRELRPLGEFFAVEAVDDAEADLRLVGDLGRVDGIGWQMAGGRLVVDGAAGDLVGGGMTGGVIRVNGPAGRMAACEMAGGELHITGDVGDFAASTLPGSMDGMRGGLLLVHGSAGARFADRMRRGTAIVLGDAGDFLASRLVAGTVVLGGRCGRHPGYGMRRGTLVFAGAAPELPATSVPAGAEAAVFWQLLSRDLARIGATHLPEVLAGVLTALPGRLIRRHLGDRSVDGRGEMIF